MNRTFGALMGLGVLVVLFFAVNILSGATLRSARIDLTESGLYTLSEGSRNIARDLQEDVRLTFYFSRSLIQDRPTIKNYGTRVRELLEEYERSSGGRITLTVIDPEPFSEDEDDAVASGLKGIPAGSKGETVFLGLVGTNALDGREVVPYFDRSEEQFLEYELTRMIYTLANPDLKTVGLISSLPINGGGTPNPMQPRPQPRWRVMTEIAELFRVVEIPTTSTEIPADVDVLMVVHPKDLSRDLQYAIDQFVLGGGHAIFCVDPHCEADLPPDAGQNPMAAFQAKRDSNLPDLFRAWGFELKPNVIAADMDNAIVVGHNSGGQTVQTTYVVYLQLQDEFIETGDAITGRLGTINIGCGGILEPIDGATTTFTSLLNTSSNSMGTDVMQVKIMNDPKALITDFESGNTELVVAARVQGAVKTAFPDRGGPGHLAESTEPINIVVIADVDMLHNRFWVTERQMLGMTLVRRVADNGTMVVNAVDNLVGSGDLINVRARGKYVRPFSRVKDIRKAAEERYLAQEKELQDALRATETKINELQSQKSGDGRLILSSEQKDTIERFNAERAETRKKLRDVQLNLRKDIEKLGLKLKALNIGLVPFLLVIAAIGLAVFRTMRRTSDRRVVAQT